MGGLEEIRNEAVDLVRTPTPPPAASSPMMHALSTHLLLPVYAASADFSLD
jgi:hypothetical protein